MSTPMERGILFSGAMVRALLDGKKTQTRRAVKPQPETKPDGRWTWIASSTARGETGKFRYAWPDADGSAFTARGRESGVSIRCPYGQPGDRLWVRETHVVSHPEAGPRTDARPVSADGRWCFYRATEPDVIDFAEGEVRWTPSLLMPRWASRLTLAVTEVRVERAQDISDADIAAEGVDAEAVEALWEAATRKQRWAALPGFSEPGVTFRTQKPIARWQLAWTLINGRESWDANPWVWVVSFKPEGARP